MRQVLQGHGGEGAEFARYDQVDLVAMTDCGDCPGLAVARVKLLSEITHSLGRESKSFIWVLA